MENSEHPLYESDGRESPIFNPGHKTMAEGLATLGLGSAVWVFAWTEDAGRDPAYGPQRRYSSRSLAAI
jgi:hypothetical protein